LHGTPYAHTRPRQQFSIASISLRIAGDFHTHYCNVMYRVAQKSKPLPNYQKIALNRIKPVDEIRFIRQIQV